LNAPFNVIEYVDTTDGQGYIRGKRSLPDFAIKSENRKRCLRTSTKRECIREERKEKQVRRIIYR